MSKQLFSLVMALLILGPSLPLPLSFAQTATTATQTFTSGVTEQDRKNQEEWLKNNRNYTKDIRREVSDIQRDSKTIDVTKVSDLIGKYEACITSMESKTGTQDFWNFTRDCDDISKLFNDELQDNLRPQRNCANNKKSIDDRKKEKKNNIDTQLKDILRNDKNADVSALNAIITNINNAFAKADQLSSGVCTVDIGDQLNDISRDLNDFFSEWYNASGEVSQKSNDARQLDEGKKDFEKNIRRQCEKDIASQMKQLDKDYARGQKDGTLSQDATEAYQSVKEDFQDMCVAQIQLMQDAINANNFEDFNDERQAFWDIQKDFWDSLNETRNLINLQQQVKDVLKEIGNREKDVEKMRKELERATKAGNGEVPNSQGILDQIVKLFEEAKSAVKEDPQSWWNDYQNEINDLQNEFWQSFNVVQRTRDFKRWYKDLEREVQNREKELKNMKREEGFDQEVLSKLEEIFSAMKSTIDSAGQALSAGDPDTAESALREMDTLRFDWDEATRALWETKQNNFQKEQILREVNHAQKELEKMLKKKLISQEEYDQCFAFAEDVRSRLEVGTIENPEDLEEESIDACEAFDRIGPAPGPDRGYYQEFFQKNTGFDENAGNIAADVFERMSQEIAERVLAKVLNNSGVLENLFTAAGERYKESLAGSLEGITGFYDENTQNDLLTKKTEILELNKKLEELQQQVQIAQDKLAELQKIQDEVASYNFYGSAGDDIRNEMESFVEQAQGLSKDQIRKKIDQFKAKKDEAIQNSKQAKFDANIIPFFDTDDNEWFTKYAGQVKEKGLVQGTGTSGGKEFNPSGLTNVAEAITMFARIVGIDDSALPISKVGKRLPDWAQAAAGTLDEEGVALDDIFGGKNPGDTVSRGEVARLLVQVLDLESVDPSEADIFTDIRLANGDEKSAIAAVLKAQIMTGQGGEGPKVFDVKGPLNRAALAKILTVVPIGE